jgi:small GTP-binding protein
MIQKKICMLGSFAVGKTSLVARFLTQAFSGKYHTTVGVKIDKKTVRVRDTSVDLIVWDLQGEDSTQQVYQSYLRGMSGYLLVIDGTRRASLEAAIRIHDAVASMQGQGPAVPFLALVNKRDVEQEWEVQEQDLEKLGSQSWTILKTSAKTGEHVEEAFLRLANQAMQGRTDATAAPGS